MVADVLLFVHSPLVGPSTWGPVAAMAHSRGWSVRVPDLTAVDGSSPLFWETLMLSAVDAVADTAGRVVVVGHSGAGVFLPVIGQCLEGRLQALVFVDAQVPPTSGGHVTPPDLEKLLDENTVDGVVSKWWGWWPSDALEEAVPDPALRAVLQADMPHLPRSFYDETVPVPDGWSEWPCGYVKLSSGYQALYEDATGRGWPGAEIDGHHLSLATEPGPVLDAIESLITRLEATSRQT